MGLIGRPRPATVERGSRRSCTLVDLSSCGGRGGTAVAVRGERQGPERSGTERPRSWRKPRVETTGTRNDSGPSPCPHVGPGRNQQDPRMNGKRSREDQEQGTDL